MAARTIVYTVPSLGCISHVAEEQASSCTQHLVLLHSTPRPPALNTSSSCTQHLVLLHSAPRRPALNTSSSCTQHLVLLHSTPRPPALNTSSSCTQHLVKDHCVLLQAGLVTVKRVVVVCPCCGRQCVSCRHCSGGGSALCSCPFTQETPTCAR